MHVGTGIVTADVEVVEVEVVKIVADESTDGVVVVDESVVELVTRLSDTVVVLIEDAKGVVLMVEVSIDV